MSVARKLVRAQRFRRVSPGGRGSVYRGLRARDTIRPSTAAESTASRNGDVTAGRVVIVRCVTSRSTYYHSIATDRIGGPYGARAAGGGSNRRGLLPEETCRSLPHPPVAQLVSVRYKPTVELILFSPLECHVTIAVVVESFSCLLDDCVRSIPTWRLGTGTMHYGDTQLR